MGHAMGVTTRRVKWVEKMGFEHIATVAAMGHPSIATFRMYNWPKGDGRKFDRTVVMTVYDDGSFQTALDDSCLHYDKASQCLQAMALAAEQVGDE